MKIITAYTIFGIPKHYYTSSVTTIPTSPTAPTSTATTSTTTVQVPATSSTNSKWDINLSTTPHPSAGSLISQGTKLHSSSKVLPWGNIHRSCGRGMYQTSPREAEELRAVPAAYSRKTAHTQTQHQIRGIQGNQGS